ncbi:MAG TPA: hypothetical protein VGI39_10970 [Polyangiaceae bacterium]
MKTLRLVFFLTPLTLGTFAACGSTGGNNGNPGNTTPDGSIIGIYGDSGIILQPDSGSLLPPNGDGGTQGTLAISPMAPTVTVVTGQPAPTIAFMATVNGQATGVAWSFDRGELGAVSSSGVFTPTGNLGGVGHVTASYGSLTVSTSVTVVLQTTQNGDPSWSATPQDAGAGGYGGVGGSGPGGPPSSGQSGTLGGTPTADATVTFLYPYDGTVWPLGLLAPLLQWNPGSHTFDSAYVHIKETNYEYKGYFAANATPFVNLPVPQSAWEAMAASNGGEPVQVSVVFGEGANAVGPVTETWTIAPALLQGTIYYNSYGTSLVQNSGTDGLDKPNNLQYGAGTLAIASGATAPTLAAGINSINPSGDGSGCRVCHTVSGDGKTLVTQASNASATDYSDSVYVNLANDTTKGAGTSLATKNLAFPALTKDGSLLFSSAGGMINGDNNSTLYTMPAGTPVAGVTGLPGNFQAALPAFSPDGTHVAFNFWSGSLPAADAGATLNADQMSLTVLDFDGTKTFSNARTLYTPSGGPVAYPSFFPTSTAVVFEVETNGSNGYGFTWHGNTGELWWADLATHTGHRLDQANGYDATGKIYLPTGGAHTPAVDVTVNYEPTVNPIASGGYAWVVFTSRRLYGNVATVEPWTSDPRKYAWREQITPKKLWVTAVDLNAKPGTDPSHPAFYLPAQEIHAGNARGFWSVDACRPDGSSCTAGDMCCGGFCQPGGADGGLICTSQKPTCAGELDKCTTTSDCCGAAQGIQCINNICTVSAPK